MAVSICKAWQTNVLSLQFVNDATTAIAALIRREGHFNLHAGGAHD